MNYIYRLADFLSSNKCSDAKWEASEREYQKVLDREEELFQAQEREYQKVLDREEELFQAQERRWKVKLYGEDVL